jgi:hypothetical protein
LEYPLDNNNNAGRNLKKLVETGLIVEVGGLWHRRQSVFWQLCASWYEKLLGQVDTEIALGQPTPRPPGR